MKALKISGVVLGSLMVLGFLFMLGYKIKYSQGVIEGYTVNAAAQGPKVLIASQGSPFKEAVVRKLTDGLKGLNASIKIIDVTALPEEGSNGWDAVVLLNAVEAWKMHKAVDGFLKQYECADNVILLATSGDGDMLPEGIMADAVTTASELSLADEKTAVIMKKLEKLLLQARPTNAMKSAADQGGV